MSSGFPDNLSDFALMRNLLQSHSFQNLDRASLNLTSIASLRIPLDLFKELLNQLTGQLATVSDPDMALNNLERFFQESRSPVALAAMMQRDPTAMPILLKIFSTSQYLADQLVRDPASYDALRLAAGQPVTREALIDHLDQALSVIPDDDFDAAMKQIRRFKHRETLRIGFGDIIAHQTTETVTSQISHLADAISTATLEFAHRKLRKKHGQPIGRDKLPAPITVIAMGKLGGMELNYSSDIDLVFFYREDGQTNGERSIANRDFFDRVGRLFVRLLSENTPLGNAYRVDMRLRPYGAKAPLSCSIDRAIGYYDLQGRTWERQALVKARPVAGDLALGHKLLGRLHKWVYAKRLSSSEINGIKALKRQIERRARQHGQETSNVKTGHGGIRDVEFVIQFLQLLHGNEIKGIRSGNTLESIDRLYQAGCLNSQERAILDTNYRWLRRLEHRLQIMFDLQTHSLPDSRKEQIQTAVRMGVQGSTPEETLKIFQQRLSEVTTHNRAILDHLLHNAFAQKDDGADGEQSLEGSAEADLVLDPSTNENEVRETLSGYGFVDPLAAHRNLTMLATERSRFLNARRCRHFLAAIARKLLTEIGNTPDPDHTLLNLAKVSDSLGGKSAIWELFSNHPASMNLYVRLCSSCEYLCRILVENPGMIDELMDALVIQQLPRSGILRDSLNQLLAKAQDSEPIIHSFKDAHHLRVGVRDITGQDLIARSHMALADIADVCLEQVIAIEHHRLVDRFGQPVDLTGQPAYLQILALGKLGGAEPNYHSDLDLVFWYDQNFTSFSGSRHDATSHQDFFSRLAANVVKHLSGIGPYGKLYDVDCRLRPTGKSGSLVVSVSELRKYFDEGKGQLWERLAMCKARPLPQAGLDDQIGTELILQMVTAFPWQASFANEIANMRFRMQQGASPHNLKRGIGGTVDIEFSIQMLQLKFASQFPEVLVPNTLAAGETLARLSLLSREAFEFFSRSWQMLRWVEARFQLMETPAMHDLPVGDKEFAHLAFLLGYRNHQSLRKEIDALRRENRRRFLKLVDAHS